MQFWRVRSRKTVRVKGPNLNRAPFILSVSSFISPICVSYSYLVCVLVCVCVSTLGNAVDTTCVIPTCTHIIPTACVYCEMHTARWPGEWTPWVSRLLLLEYTVVLTLTCLCARALARRYRQLDEFRVEIQRRDQEILAMSAKMKTLEEQHQDYQRHIAVLKESLCAKEEHYNMLQADVSILCYLFKIYYGILCM